MHSNAYTYILHTEYVYRQWWLKMWNSKKHYLVYNNEMRCNIIYSR